MGLHRLMSWKKSTLVLTEPMFKYRADICSYLTDSARGAPNQMNMCDTWAVKYWGPIEKLASKKKYMQVTADAQTST